MMDIEDFNNFLVFRYINNSIVEGSLLSETYKNKIYYAKDFIKKTLKSLDLIFDIKQRIREDESFEIEPPIKQVMECCKKDISKMSLDDILEVKEKLSLISNALNKLKENPKKFYDSEDAEKVFDFIEDLLYSFTYMYYN